MIGDWRLQHSIDECGIWSMAIDGMMIGRFEVMAAGSPPNPPNRHFPNHQSRNTAIANGMVQSPNRQIVNNSSIVIPQSSMDA